MGNIRKLDQLLSALKRGYTIQKGADKTAPSFYAVQNQKKNAQHFCITLAEKTISIDSQYDEVYKLCRNYLSNAEPEIRISITDEDIAHEYDEAKDEKIAYMNSYLETLAVYRKISKAMLDYDTILMHGAVVAYDNSAYMFTAKSGTGKTTHIRKWIENLDGAYIVNGDKPLIKMTETKAIACGTPWCGKEGLETNSMVPLQAIVLMERGEDNQITEISFMKAFAFLLQQTYQPDEPELMKMTLRIISQLKGKVRFYHYIFNNMKEDAFGVTYDALAGGKV